MRFKWIVVAISLASLGMMGCNPNAVNENAGAITGALAGGIIGNQLGKGSGNAFMTAVGAVIGYKVGSTTGQQIDEFNQSKLTNVMETSKPNQWRSWVHPRTQTVYRIKPGFIERVTVGDSSADCRPFQMILITGNETIRSSGYACKHDSYGWEYFSD